MKYFFSAFIILSALLTGTSVAGKAPLPEMVVVKGGCYFMGSPMAEKGSQRDELQHWVCVDEFNIGKYEVTQQEWFEVMGENPSYRSCHNCPVENISWNEVQLYIEKLNRRNGKQYRLPTEAEWEYAARSGGKYEKYSGGNYVHELGWYEGNSEGKSHPVGEKEANGLGLYDMSGNVWEWCQDIYDEETYHERAVLGVVTNPISKGQGVFRVVRGGSFFSTKRWLRTADRFRNHVDTDVNEGLFGFRLAHSQGIE